MEMRGTWRRRERTEVKETLGGEKCVWQRGKMRGKREESAVVGEM